MNKTITEEDGYFFERKDIFWVGVVFFISYFFYLLSAYPTITSEDSGEFTAAVHTLGIAHPSGYPLYVIVGKIFTFLIPFGNVGWKVNIFSAFFSAATIGAVYLLLKLLTKDRAIGIVTALIFASGPIFWSQAIRAEVYGINSFLLVVIIILASMWLLQVQLNKKEQTKTLLWLSFLYGLSVTNHHLMLMAGVPLLLLVVISQPKIFLHLRLVGKAFLLFLGGLSLYLFIPIRASYKPAMNWGNPITAESFWNHITRKVYYADALSPTHEFITNPKSIQTNPIVDFFQFHVWEFFKRFAVIMDQNYSWIIFLFVALGFAFLWKRSRQLFWFFIALVIFYGPIFSALIGLGYTEKLPMNFFIDRPFYIPLLLLAVIIGGMGIRYLTSLQAFQGKKTAPASSRKIAIAALTAFTSLLLVYRFPSQNQSTNYLMYDLAKAYLQILPADAVVHSENGDNTIFPIMYLQKVEKVKEGVIFYIDMPTNIYPYFEDLAEMEKQNPGKRIFTDFPFVEYPDKMYNYLGPVSEILPFGATASNQQDPEFYENFKPRGIDSNNLDHFHQYMRARYYLDMALMYGDNPAKQDQLFQKAFEAAPESINITGQLIGNYYLRSGEYSKAIPYLEPAQKLMPEEESINFGLAFSYIVTGQGARAEEFMESLEASELEAVKNNLTLFAQQQPGKYPLLEEFLEKN